MSRLDDDESTKGHYCQELQFTQSDSGQWYLREKQHRRSTGGGVSNQPNSNPSRPRDLAQSDLCSGACPLPKRELSHGKCSKRVLPHLTRRHREPGPAPLPIAGQLISQLVPSEGLSLGDGAGLGCFPPSPFFWCLHQTENGRGVISAPVKTCPACNTLVWCLGVLHGSTGGRVSGRYLHRQSLDRDCSLCAA